MPNSSAAKKISAVREVLAGASLKEVSQKYNCSRQSLYSWIKKYQENPSKAGARLKNSYKSGNKHHKSLGWQAEKLVLDLVVREPDLGLRKLKSKLAEAGFKVSEHGIYNILVRHELQTRELRHKFSFIHPVKTLFATSIVPAYRVKAIEEHLKDGKKISQVCRAWKISRVTFYAWLKRYRKAVAEDSGNIGLINSLARGYKSGWENKRSCSESAREVVRNIVIRNPKYSVAKIYAEIPIVSGKPVVGHHGIQNILEREGLNTYEKRLRFAQGYSQTPEVAIAPLYVPQMPLYKLRHLIAHFATVPKLVIADPKRSLPYAFVTLSSLILFVLWIRLLFTTPNASPIGLFFSSIALMFGLFFFIYSMKYYITVLLVLKLAQGGSSFAKASEDKGASEGSLGRLGFLGKLAKRLGLKAPSSRVNPLSLNLDKVELRSHPFVSIHVALYNERRVVERLIKACEGQEYYEGTIDNSQLTIDQKNQKSNVNGQLSTVGSAAHSTGSGPVAFEVIIADDSTDETTEIAKQLLATDGRILDRTFRDEEMEIYVSSPPVGSSLPIIKLIHRFSRSGYKGAALQRALENTNPKAAYISVFDADFVPYPDTVTQFVKTFQELSTEIIDHSPESTNYELNTQNSSRIAAVQGYQWHVLNKSQTWITRGVRTEYAGSYVIERAGEEIYGGLKQIAGSVYAIRADVLRQFGWGTSITEDFELTLRLYEAGYKVAFTPYIQAPAEAVSTIKRLVRQRMRWAEGASYNIKVMLPRLLFGRWEEAKSTEIIDHSAESTNYDLKTQNSRVWRPSGLTRMEKLEFAYLAPYYLQAAFFVVGTFSWFIAEAVIGARLPFWTAALGWSLVFTNILALPLMNIVGLFLEESDERDYIGILSFVALSYIVVPFQAYAAIKGFLETEEGPWFRTPKTGIVTDTFGRSGFSKFFGSLLGKKPQVAEMSQESWGLRNLDTPVSNQRMALATANNRFDSFYIKPGRSRYLGNFVILVMSALTAGLFYFGTSVQKGTIADLPIKTRVQAASSNDSIFSQAMHFFAASDVLAAENKSRGSGVQGLESYLLAIAIFLIIFACACFYYLFRKKRTLLKKIVRAVLVLVLVSSWLLSGWPVVWEKPRFPPKIPEAQAAITVAGSRFFNSSRTALAAEDVSLTNYNKANVFIMTIGIQTAAGDRCDSGDAYTVQWQNTTDAGAWTNLGSTSDMRTETTSVLVDGNALTSAEANIVGSGTYVQNNAEEETGAGTYSARTENGDWTAVQFSVNPANALNGKQYSFRINTTCKGANATPTGAATLTTANYDQSSYTWFNNTDSTDVGTTLAAEDTAATAPAQGTAFRLRMLVHVGGGNLAASGETFKLQVAQRVGATCDTDMSTTDESYSDLSGTSGAIRYFNNTPADNSTLTNNANDPTHGAHPNVDQTYNDADGGASDTFLNSVAAINTGSDGLWDFAIVDNSATANTVYCARALRSGGTVLETYTVVPEFTTAPENPLLLFGLGIAGLKWLKRLRKKKGMRN